MQNGDKTVLMVPEPKRGKKADLEKVERVSTHQFHKARSRGLRRLTEDEEAELRAIQAVKRQKADEEKAEREAQAQAEAEQKAQAGGQSSGGGEEPIAQEVIEEGLGDLEGKSVAELRKLGAALKIEGANRGKKEDLLKAIPEAAKAAAEAQAAASGGGE